MKKEKLRVIEDRMQKSNLRLIGIPEENKIGLEKAVSSEIRAKNYPKLRKGLYPQKHKL